LPSSFSKCVEKLMKRKISIWLLIKILMFSEIFYCGGLCKNSGEIE
jgi:hypothetical protein